VGQDFDFSKDITTFQFDMQRMLDNPTKFIADAGFRLVVKRRVGVQLVNNMMGAIFGS
jgi:hypothetical protein